MIYSIAAARGGASRAWPALFRLAAGRRLRGASLRKAWVRQRSRRGKWRRGWAPAMGGPAALRRGGGESGTLEWAGRVGNGGAGAARGDPRRDVGDGGGERPRGEFGRSVRRSPWRCARTVPSPSPHVTKGLASGRASSSGPVSSS